MISTNITSLHSRLIAALVVAGVILSSPVSLLAVSPDAGLKPEPPTQPMPPNEPSLPRDLTSELGEQYMARVLDLAIAEGNVWLIDLIARRSTNERTKGKALKSVKDFGEQFSTKFLVTIENENPQIPVAAIAFGKRTVTFVGRAGHRYKLDLKGKLPDGIKVTTVDAHLRTIVRPHMQGQIERLMPTHAFDVQYAVTVDPNVIVGKYELTLEFKVRDLDWNYVANSTERTLQCDINHRKLSPKDVLGLYALASYNRQQADRHLAKIADVLGSTKDSPNWGALARIERETKALDVCKRKAALFIELLKSFARNKDQKVTYTARLSMKIILTKWSEWQRSSTRTGSPDDQGRTTSENMRPYNSR